MMWFNGCLLFFYIGLVLYIYNFYYWWFIGWCGWFIFNFMYVLVALVYVLVGCYWWVCVCVYVFLCLRLCIFMFAFISVCVCLYLCLFLCLFLWRFDIMSVFFCNISFYIASEMYLFVLYLFVLYLCKITTIRLQACDYLYKNVYTPPILIFF